MGENYGLPACGPFERAALKMNEPVAGPSLKFVFTLNWIFIPDLFTRHVGIFRYNNMKWGGW